MLSSSPEAYGSSDGPVTQHKKVRCYKENVKVGDDDRNYEIEQIRKNVRKEPGKYIDIRG
jgi:hypothetical protein